MTIFDKKFRLVVAALACVVSAPADQPKPQGAAAVSHQAEEDYRRGRRYAEGDGVQRDYIQAARYYRKAAAQGYGPAQYDLAWLLENGMGVKQDFQEAAVWYRKAAEQGDAEAQNNLGTLYATGQGVPRDDAEAVRWYSLAAKQEDPEGTTNLAMMYLQGRGVKRDPFQAFRLCRKAAEAGHPAAGQNLALMYANGDGVARDYVSAYVWLDLAAADLDSAADLRDRMAKEMTPGQLARARELASQKRGQMNASRKDPK
ncbi:MAG: tetratricopeptide repeat protein [Bryobacteraceae bacterium]